MKRSSIVIIGIVLMGASGCKTLSTYPLDFYEIKSQGSPPQMKGRMICDYASIKPGQTFRVGFFFTLQDGYYTYSSGGGHENLPTEIIFKLPQGFTVINERWSEYKIKQGKTETEAEEIYESDFKVLYTLKAPSVLPDQVLIQSTARWQVCRAELCSLGGADFQMKIATGKKKKSVLFQLFKN